MASLDAAEVCLPVLPPRVDCEGIVPGVSAVDYNAAGAPVTSTSRIGQSEFK